MAICSIFTLYTCDSHFFALPCVGRSPRRTSCMIAASCVVTLSPRSSSQSVSYRKISSTAKEAHLPLLTSSLMPNLTFPCLDMQPDPISAEKQRRQAAARRNRLRKMKVSFHEDDHLCNCSKTNFVTFCGHVGAKNAAGADGSAADGRTESRLRGSVLPAVVDGDVPAAGANDAAARLD